MQEAPLHPPLWAPAMGLPGTESAGTVSLILLAAGVSSRGVGAEQGPSDTPCGTEQAACLLGGGAILTPPLLMGIIKGPTSQCRCERQVR